MSLWWRLEDSLPWKNRNLGTSLWSSAFSASIFHSEFLPFIIGVSPYFSPPIIQRNAPGSRFQFRRRFGWIWWAWRPPRKLSCFPPNSNKWRKTSPVGLTAFRGQVLVSGSVNCKWKYGKVCDYRSLNYITKVFKHLFAYASFEKKTSIKEPQKNLESCIFPRNAYLISTWKHPMVFALWSSTRTTFSVNMIKIQGPEKRQL